MSGGFPTVPLHERVTTDEAKHVHWHCSTSELVTWTRADHEAAGERLEGEPRVVLRTAIAPSPPGV